MNILYSALSIGLAFLVITGLILLLPTGEFPTSAHDSIITMWGYLKPWTFFLNLSQFFIVLTIIVFTEGTIWAMKALFWFYTLIFKRNT